MLYKSSFKCSIVLHYQLLLKDRKCNIRKELIAYDKLQADFTCNCVIYKKNLIFIFI